MLLGSVGQDADVVCLSPTLPRGPPFTPFALRFRHRIPDDRENPDYQVRFHWEPNSIAFWDNRVSSRVH